MIVEHWIFYPILGLFGLFIIYLFDVF